MENATSGADLAPAQHVDVSVTFTALKAGKKPNTVDNVEAFAFDEHGDPLAGDDSNDELVITDPRLTVDKRLAEGQPGQGQGGTGSPFRRRGDQHG